MPGGDGWGRAFTQGLRFAIEEKFEWVVHIECDLLFALPVDVCIHRMKANGVRAAAPMAIPHPMIETGLMFMEVAYMEEIEFISKYDWEHPPPYQGAKTAWPELRVEQILGERFMPLPLRGARNDFGQITPANMETLFPHGIRWLTHANTATYRKFLQMNGMLTA